MATDSVSVREFARQIGRSHTWVQNKVKSGEITADAYGRIPLETGFAQADKLIQPSTLPDDDAENPAMKAGGLTSAKNVTEAFNKARLAEKTYQAKLKEIEYKLKKGELLERVAVEADAQQTASLVRERLMSVPVRIAGLCEGRTAREIEEIIEDGINEALELLQKSKHVK